MSHKLLATFAILALCAAAFAGTVPVPGVHSYTIAVTQPAALNGNLLRPGEYRLKVSPDKITLAGGKTPLEVKATVQTVDQKFKSTQVMYTHVSGQTVITEICIGGTRTKLIVQ